MSTSEPTERPRRQHPFPNSAQPYLLLGSRVKPLCAASLLLVLLGCFVWTWIVPAVVAECDNVYTAAAVRQRLNENGIEMNRGGEAFGHVGNVTNYAYLSSYCALTTLVFFGMRDRNNGQNNRSQLGFVLLIAFVAFGVLSVPHWFRNLGWAADERQVYSYLNLDISVASFILQELRVLGEFLILAVVWRQWSWLGHEESGERRGSELLIAEIEDGKQNGLQQLTLRYERVAHAASDAFTRWQIASLLLVVSFLPFTFFYWRLVILHSDSRYALSAVVVHLVWAATWVVISLPLFESLNNWRLCRSRLAAKSALDENLGKDEHEQIRWLIKEGQPVSTLNALGTSVVAGVSFTLPLLQQLAE